MGEEQDNIDLQKQVMDKLADAWNIFLTIPKHEQHSSDLDEFRSAIHIAQNIMNFQAYVKKHGKI